MSDKRKNPRYMCQVPVDGKVGGPFEISKTVDFSQGGLGLISRQRLPLNKRIAIELDLSQEGSSAVVIGKIAWVKAIAQSNHFRIGVSFRDAVANA